MAKETPHHQASRSLHHLGLTTTRGWQPFFHQHLPNYRMGQVMVVVVVVLAAAAAAAVEGAVVVAAAIALELSVSEEELCYSAPAGQ